MHLKTLKSSSYSIITMKSMSHENLISARILCCGKVIIALASKKVVSVDCVIITVLPLDFLAEEKTICAEH